MVDEFGDRVHVVHCDTLASEHPDNRRFLLDAQSWIRSTINTIKSSRFDSVDEVFEHRKYMSGIAGAPCTVEMKKRPRFEFQRADDIHVFGMTKDEQSRSVLFQRNNPELRLWWPLIRANLTKSDCMEIIIEAGIKPPALYALGYKNNNCLGCVKASSPAYWNSIRRDFPEVFQKRAEQSRKFGSKLVNLGGKRVFLEELPVSDNTEIDEDLSCGPQCSGGQP